MTRVNDRNIRAGSKIDFATCAVLLVAIPVMMTGCTATMSMEEAKKVYLSMDEKPLVKPPRNITDILAVLDQPGQFDARSTAQMKAELSALPPDGANDAVLARFYGKRGAAEWQLGFMKPALDDLHLALTYSQKNGRVYAHWLLVVRRDGIDKAAEAFEVFKKASPKTRSDKAQYHLYYGLLHKALNSLSDANEHFGKAYQYEPNSVYIMIKY